MKNQTNRWAPLSLQVVSTFKKIKQPGEARQEQVDLTLSIYFYLLSSFLFLISYIFKYIDLNLNDDFVYSI